ncbi:hypothetical protein LDENG_00288720 [Lucifuga dentata]|nr:hypothetical protein LDENG_00288720 [Lucifuga dentata]
MAVAVACHSGQLSSSAVQSCSDDTWHQIGWKRLVVTMELNKAYVINVDTWLQKNNSCTLCRNSYMLGKLQRLPAAVENWRLLKQNITLSTTLDESSEAFVMGEFTEVAPSWG